MSTKKTSAAYAALAALASPAAADICVSCSGPAATYACTVKKADEIETFAGAKALNKICTKVLKRTGGHDSCQVIDSGNGNCPGTAKSIGWREVKDAIAGDESDDTPSPAAAPAKPAPQPPKVVKPATPEPKAAGPTVPSDKTADVPPPEKPPADPTVTDNLKGAAEKTWKCVSSFFGEC